MDYLSTHQFAQRVGVSDGRVRQWIAAGYLAAERVGKCWIIPLSAADTFKAWPHGKRRTPWPETP